MDIDDSAANGFALEQADLPSGDGVVWQYPRGAQVGADGPLVRVDPDGRESWLARFSDAAYGPSAVPNRIFAMPDGATFCVLAGGNGYIVSAADPDQWIQVGCFPITCYAQAEEVVAFGDFSGMCGYHGTREVWSAGLFWDDLAITSIEGRLVHVNGYEAGETLTATIDVVTGEER